MQNLAIIELTQCGRSVNSLRLREWLLSGVFQPLDNRRLGAVRLIHEHTSVETGHGRLWSCIGCLSPDLCRFRCLEGNLI